MMPPSQFKDEVETTATAFIISPAQNDGNGLMPAEGNHAEVTPVLPVTRISLPLNHLPAAFPRLVVLLPCRTICAVQTGGAPP
jgi:hypothetical protein